MANEIQMTEDETLAIDCQGLTYAFAEGLESALDGVDLSLKKGDRCLLVGANGGMLCLFTSPLKLTIPFPPLIIILLS